MKEKIKIEEIKNTTQLVNYIIQNIQNISDININEQFEDKGSYITLTAHTFVMISSGIVYKEGKDSKVKIIGMFNFEEHKEILKIAEELDVISPFAYIYPSFTNDGRWHLRLEV